MRAAEPGDQPDLARYIEFVKAQVRELCSNYGTIHGFWWDANVIKHRDPSINALIRQLQPNAVINNRGYASQEVRERVLSAVSELGYVPKNYPQLAEAQMAEVGAFLQELEEHDDVHRVWAAVK